MVTHAAILRSPVSSLQSPVLSRKIHKSSHVITVMFSRKKARETQAEEALKDMIPPQDSVSLLTKGKRDLDDLLDDSTKKMKVNR